MRGGSYWSKRQQLWSRRRLLVSGTVGGASIAGLALAGCGTKPQATKQATASSGQSAQAAPQRGGILNVYWRDNLPLDPQKVSATPQRAVGGVYSRLFRFKSGLDPNLITNHDAENDLAASLESPDALTWTVKLRTDAKFHNVAPVNGHPVEAEDVKATFLRAVDPATNSPNRGTIDMINPNQIETPDKQTVVFKLNYAYAPFPKILSSAVYSWIMPREVLSAGYDPAKLVIGSGPFIMESAVPDVAYTYKRNPDWFEKGLPYIDGYKLSVIPDASRQQAQFAAGNLDELIVADAYQLDATKQQNPKATIFKEDYNSANPMYFQLGEADSQFMDIRVRRAFSMAIDRDAISKAIYNGQSELLVYVPGYMGKWAVKVSDLPQDIQQYYKYNPSEAKKLLDAAGFNESQVIFAYQSTVPSNVKHVETAASMLSAIGIKTSVIGHDYNKDFIDSGHGSRQGFFPKNLVGMFNQSPYEDADLWLYTYFHSKSVQNQEHLKDPTYDAMVDKQRTLVNEADRLKAVREILTYFADKMYAPNSVSPPQWSAIQPRVQNYQFSSTLGVGTETYAKLWLKA
jgi:peptide/nickel transport system substrate-binding protein